MYNCKKMDIQPDILSFETAEWNIGKNIVLKELEKEATPCGGIPKRYMAFYDDGKTALRALDTCLALGGVMPVPTNWKEFDELKNAIVENGKKFPKCSEKQGTYLPIFQDAKIQRKWTDAYHKEIKNIPWQAGQPNGEHFQKCVEFSYGSIWDVECDKTTNCYYCKMRKNERFSLKGVCKKDAVNSNGGELDEDFMIKPGEDEKPYWRGFYKTEIRWNIVKEHWQITQLGSNKIVAVYNDTKEFPIGKRDWVFFDNNCAALSKDKRLTLMLSKCSKDEFPCTHGNCIPLTKKCDFARECIDGYDEIGCKTLDEEWLGNEYDPTLPNIVPNEDGKFTTTAVNISIDVTEITSLEEIKMTFSVKFRLKLLWFDSRIRWFDLSENKYFNILKESETKRIFVPLINFANTNSHDRIQVDDKATVVVERRGNYTTSSKHILKPLAYYNGDENPIYYQRKYHLKFNCEFHLAFYPFDTQHCYMILTKPKKLRKFVNLIPDIVSIRIQ